MQYRKAPCFLEEAAIPVHLTHDLESSKFGERARLPIVQGPFIKFLGQTSTNCCVFFFEGDSSRKWTVELRAATFLCFFVQFSTRECFSLLQLCHLFFQMVCYCWWQTVMIEHSIKKGTYTPWDYLSPLKSMAGTWPFFCGMTIFHGLLVPELSSTARFLPFTPYVLFSCAILKHQRLWILSPIGKKCNNCDMFHPPWQWKPKLFESWQISWELMRAKLERLPSLKPTANAPEHGWFEYDCFLLGPKAFFQKQTVSFRECTYLTFTINWSEKM